MSKSLLWLISLLAYSQATDMPPSTFTLIGGVRTPEGVAALLRRDLARVLSVLQWGLAPAEQADFVARLTTQAVQANP